MEKTIVAITFLLMAVQPLSADGVSKKTFSQYKKLVNHIHPKVKRMKDELLDVTKSLLDEQQERISDLELKIDTHHAYLEMNTVYELVETVESQLAGQLRSIGFEDSIQSRNKKDYYRDVADTHREYQTFYEEGFKPAYFEMIEEMRSDMAVAYLKELMDYAREYYEFNF